MTGIFGGLLVGLFLGYGSCFNHYNGTGHVVKFGEVDEEWKEMRRKRESI